MTENIYVINKETGEANKIVIEKNNIPEFVKRDYLIINEAIDIGLYYDIDTNGNYSVRK